MASTAEEITMNYFEETEDDQKIQLVKELDKKILSKGAWTTIMFKYQDLDKKSGEFKPAKVSIRRFQKVNGEFRKKSHFNISSDAQAKLIIEALNEWMEEE